MQVLEQKVNYFFGCWCEEQCKKDADAGHNNSTNIFQ